MHLKCDLFLLADMFEKFRNSRLKNYGLCQSHCLRTPDLSWDAVLNMTKVEFELTLDADMYLLFEKNMRGGVSCISKRYCSKANNNYLKSYDPKQESKHIIYLDGNILYGYAMSKFIPTCGFTWIDHKELDMNKYSRNISKGCVLEVDLEYPKELREVRNNYFLAPDKIEIKKEVFVVIN